MGCKVPPCTSISGAYAVQLNKKTQKMPKSHWQKEAGRGSRRRTKEEEEVEQRNVGKPQGQEARKVKG